MKVVAINDIEKLDIFQNEQFLTKLEHAGRALYT
jgi:hypothetical protein